MCSGRSRNKAVKFYCLEVKNGKDVGATHAEDPYVLS